MPDVLSIAALTGGSQAVVWDQFVNNLQYTAISLVPKWLRPDQIYQGLGSKTEQGGDGRSNTVRVHQLVFHESGHFSHAMKAGDVFWGNMVGAIINNQIAHNDPYHNGTSPNLAKGEQIGLVEGWATFTEFKVTSFYYGKAYINPSVDLDGDGFIGDDRAFLNYTEPGNGASIDRFMENFNVYDRPMGDLRFDDRSWFLHGIMWDLIDSRGEIEIGSSGVTFSRRRSGSGVSLNNIVDNIQIGSSDNYDLSWIFNTFDSNVYNICDFREALKVVQPGFDPAINELFNSYGYICNNQP